MAQFGTSTRRYHVHWPGVFAIGLTVFLMIGAVNSQNNLLFIVFGLALSSIVVSGVISGTMLLGITASRAPTPMISAGETGEIEYTITKGGWGAPAFALLVREIDPPKGASHARPGTRARTLPALAPCVRVGQTVRVRARTEAIARGVVPLVGIEISTSFPFGVFRKSIRFADRGEVLIAPATRPVSTAELASLHGNKRSGSVTRARAGRGLDFFGLRDYVPGDSPKRVAWKAWARTDQMVVHQAADEPSHSVRIALALDIADGEDACERAISEAASLALSAVEDGLVVELIVADRSGRLMIGDERGRVRVLGALARLELEGAADAGAGAALRGADFVVVASGPRGRAKAPGGRVWSVVR